MNQTLSEWKSEDNAKETSNVQNVLFCRVKHVKFHSCLNLNYWKKQMVKNYLISSWSWSFQQLINNEGSNQVKELFY